MRETIRLNPNPITKLIATILLGFTVTHSIGFFGWGVTIWIALFFLINGYRIDALKAMLYFALFYKLPEFEVAMTLPGVLKMFVAILVCVKMFYLPFAAGKLFIKTSDVGSILVSMDMCRVPKVFSIPFAVMFRFFPSFKEERAHIKQAMTIRGITLAHPLRYMEYVSVPLLIISSNIADDIAMAAETKGIANPGKKTHFRDFHSGIGDVVYLLGIFGFTLWGWLC